MDSKELKTRTKKFAVEVINFLNSLNSRSHSLNTIRNQLIRSATSVGANYRSACRARSQNDFISKITICEEEADESLYWIELLIETKVASQKEVEFIIKEADELTAIFTASGNTAKNNKAQKIN